MAIDPIGRGFSFPLRVDTLSGRIAASAGERRVQESIMMILGTYQGERIMRPDYGSRLRDLVFAPNSSATANLARYYVTDALTRWEPRITLGGVTVVNQEGESGPELRIAISYVIKATAEPNRLEFALAIG